MSFNKTQLRKDTKELNKAKAPKKSRDIIYDPAGQWKFPGQDYVFPGADYVDEYPQMKKGGRPRGLVPMPKPSKKGLASKAYSRSLDATNKLFTENRLFEKPKDRRRKVFDPNAKYYQDGGEYGMPLGTGVSQNFIGNRDEFKVGGIPELPLRDNQVNYDAYVNRFEPKTRLYEDGGIIAELTDEEIQAYKEGGYIVEDISIPSLTKAQNGGAAIIGEEYVYKKRPGSVYKVNDRGEWQIKNKSTKGKFVTIKDPEGTRSKELDRKAIPLFEYQQQEKERIKKLVDEVKNPKEFLDIADTRTIRATTGQKINPNVDLKGGKYNKAVINKIVEKSKKTGVDPATMLAIALQETNFGKTDPNLGHILDGGANSPYAYINFYKKKLEEAKRAKINDELLQIQYYNGLGTITPRTEKGYHGFEMQKIYGVPIPAGGINMRKNPLYGKQIKDLRDNVILKNAYIQGLLKQQKKGGVVSKLSKTEIKDLVAQGYIVEEVD